VGIPQKLATRGVGKRKKKKGKGGKVEGVAQATRLREGARFVHRPQKRCFGFGFFFFVGPGESRLPSKKGNGTKKKI